MMLVLTLTCSAGCFSTVSLAASQATLDAKAKAEAEKKKAEEEKKKLEGQQKNVSSQKAKTQNYINTLNQQAQTGR